MKNLILFLCLLSATSCGGCQQDKRAGVLVIYNDAGAACPYISSLGVQEVKVSVVGNSFNRVYTFANDPRDTYDIEVPSKGQFQISFNIDEKQASCQPCLNFCSSGGDGKPLWIGLENITQAGTAGMNYPVQATFSSCVC